MYLKYQNLGNNRTILYISSLKLFSTSKLHNFLFPTPTFQYPNATTQLFLPYSSHLHHHFFLVSSHISNYYTLTDQHRFNELMTSNKMITNYIRSGDFDSALKLFESMPVMNTVTWNSILAGYIRMPGKVSDARQLFDRIPEPDYFSYNTMLACYANSSDIISARTFFDEMPVRDVASWNTMISCFSRNGMMREACELFWGMTERNSVTWSAMISGYVESGYLGSAVKLFEIAPVKSVVAWTAMVTGFMKFGNVKMAEQVFSEMLEKNLVTWNSMIAGYVDNGQSEDALKLFRRMVESGVRPNPSSLSSVLLGCSDLSSLKLGKQVHQFISKSPLQLDITVGTSLISMYCKCGDLEDAWELFNTFSKKDVVTWNAMISGYAQHGAGEKALNLFDKMRNHGIKPDWITFVAVLSACNHAGLVDTGVKYFYAMQKDYGVKAKPDHYTCVVNLLGRAGKLVEAVDLVKTMSFKPHPAVFGILLGACRIHKNLEVAEFAARSLLNCDPASATAYVQLANVYAAMKKWDYVSTVRRSMKENNVIKVPGCSWIEVKNVVHEFRSGDRLHPELKSIHEKLNEVEKKLKLAGYVPNFDSVLQDVDEEQKRQMLLWHSERLAIAYGLIKLPLATPIRLFKNLRVCGDCHQATKFISKTEGREIIVRDTTRFHHFKDGVCSCGDYW